MLTIVTTSRNDDHGQNLAGRTQRHIDNLYEQANAFREPIEYILVEWNPSAGLWEGQTDEGEIGLCYYEIDREIVEFLNGDGPMDDTLVNLHRHNMHKSEPGKSLLTTRW